MWATPRRWSSIPPAPPTSRWMPPSSRRPAWARSSSASRSALRRRATSLTISVRRCAPRSGVERMELAVDGAKVHAATGGRDFDPTRPLVVFLHGASLDHTVWALLARWFAHRGHAVLAPDLPGHGRSEGAPLASIAAMADWTAALIAASGASRATIVGHSMGSLVALETAARHSERVAAIGLIGTAAAMPVSRELLAAAEANDHAAIDMLRIWGYGFRAGLGGSLAPGMWMLGGAERLLERARPGV